MWWSQKQFPVPACHLNIFNHKIILLLHHSLAFNLDTNIKMEQNNNIPPPPPTKPQAQIHHESDTQSQTAPSQCMAAVGSAGNCLPLQRPVTPWRYSPNRPQFMLNEDGKGAVKGGHILHPQKQIQKPLQAMS